MAFLSPSRSSARHGSQRGRHGGPAVPALLLLPLLVSWGSGCSEQGETGAYRIELYDRPVVCDAQEGRCTDARGETAPIERLVGVAYVSRLASQYAPHGLYAYLEFRRRSGVRGLLELDLPYQGNVTNASLPPRLHFLELQGDQVVFRGARVMGRVELPLGADCSCQDGRLELLFVDFGPDRVEGGGDDRVRRLSRTQFSRNTSFCRNPELLPLGTKLEVLGLLCPSWARHDHEDEVEEDGTLDAAIGCGVEPVEVDALEEWEYVELGEGEYEPEGAQVEEGEAEPEGTAVDVEGYWDEDEDEDAGCDGDTTEDDDDEERGGCSGDSSTDSTGGCEGSDGNADGDGDGSGDDDESSGCAEADTMEDGTDDPADYDPSSGCSEGDSSTSYSSSEGSGDCSSSDSGDSSSSACEADAEAAVGPPSAPRPEHAGASRQRPHRTDPTLRLVLAGLLIALVRRVRRRS